MKTLRTILLPALLLLALLCPKVGQANSGNNGYATQIREGKSALNKKLWRKAIEHFHNALSWDRDSVSAHLGLGQAYVHLGRKNHATREFNTVLYHRPGLSSAKEGLEIVQKPDYYDTFFVEISNFAKETPENALIRATLADQLMRRKQPEEARKEAEEAIKLNPKLGDPYCTLGHLLIAEGKDEEARPLLLKAIRLDRFDDDAFAALGDLEVKQKRYKQAASYYRTAVRLAPDEVAEYKKLLVVLTELKRDEEVEKTKRTLSELEKVQNKTP